MGKRIWIYLKEMYPPFSRLGLAAGLFFTIYFLIIALYHIPSWSVGIGEVTAVLTIYTFLLSLRIADEFKDLDTDYKNYPNRPLPSGRVKKHDLIVLLLAFQIPTIFLNILVMHNWPVFILLYCYGALMSVWFFAKRFIKPNLALALVTHNPVELILNTYVASYICGIFGLPLFSTTTMLIIITLYLPGLIWEIGRKIRAPKHETAYVTYSKIWGYKRAVSFVIFLVLLAAVLGVLLTSKLSVVGTVALLTVAAGTIAASFLHMQKPGAFSFGKIIMPYIYTQQLTLLITALGSIMRWWS